MQRWDLHPGQLRLYLLRLQLRFPPVASWRWIQQGLWLESSSCSKGFPWQNQYKPKLPPWQPSRVWFTSYCLLWSTSWTRCFPLQKAASTVFLWATQLSQGKNSNLLHKYRWCKDGVWDHKSSPVGHLCCTLQVRCTPHISHVYLLVDANE